MSVVVPAFNAAATVGRTLAALAKQDLEGPYEVIVVDDGSDDGTGRVIAAAGGRVRLLRQANRGPAAARNAGARAANAPVLAFTDADCFPRPDWLRHGLAALREADLVQGQVLPDPAARPGPFDRTITIRREYGLYEGANLFVEQEVFERLGRFEDWLPARVGKPLAEDVWLGWRARRAGARTAFCAGALVHHAVFPRGPAGYLVERVRLVYFPAMVAKIPELREAFLYRRWFLTSRTAAFDLAVAGLAAMLAGRDRRNRRPALVGAAMTLPYLRVLVSGASRGGAMAPLVAAVDAVADGAGLLALALGSVRWRTAVL